MGCVPTCYWLRARWLKTAARLGKACLQPVRDKPPQVVAEPGVATRRRLLITAAKPKGKDTVSYSVETNALCLSPA